VRVAIEVFGRQADRAEQATSSSRTTGSSLRKRIQVVRALPSIRRTTDVSRCRPCEM
jgi:hypothetical protein